MDSTDHREQYERSAHRKLPVTKHQRAKRNDRKSHQDFRAGHCGTVQMHRDTRHHRQYECHDEGIGCPVRRGETANRNHGGEVVQPDDRVARVWPPIR